MDKGYVFDTNDFPKIAIHLLVEVMGYLQASTDAFLGKFSGEEAERIIKRIDEILPEKKEKVLQALYTRLGSTPSV